MDANTITFDKLNSIYSDIEGINVLSDTVGYNIELQQYIVSEVEDHHYDLYASPEADKKNRTIAERDTYFLDLIEKLSTELERRGMHNEASVVSSYSVGDIETGELANPRMTNEQYIRSLRGRRIERAIELGLNKTNAKALSYIIEQLCIELYTKEL